MADGGRSQDTPGHICTSTQLISSKPIRPYRGRTSRVVCCTLCLYVLGKSPVLALRSNFDPSIGSPWVPTGTATIWVPATCKRTSRQFFANLLRTIQGPSRELLRHLNLSRGSQVEQYPTTQDIWISPYSTVRLLFTYLPPRRPSLAPIRDDAGPPRLRGALP
jgi:hypothetical protein